MTAAAHPLDNPIWESLGGGHARFAQSAGSARRFTPEVSVLAGFSGEPEEGLAALAGLTAPGESAGVFFTRFPDAHPGWTFVRGGELLQMVHGGGAIAAAARDFVELGAGDVPEMLALTARTKPGPFSARTHELGLYLGVRDGGRLAALSGERLKLPGWTEISAVCTHPDFLGRGYAGALMAEVGRRILARGERPFLHVLPGNARAIALYERLGFSRRRLFRYAILRRG
ncbi:MAG: GNAT family N-acetyltransferase [Elusimicrobia bacterium]|nr:GNAT family N-acetyltransferase [Elusimicrobiota bacterium]